MSDRFDPKPSARPTGGRSGPGGGAEDPLAELARLVSGRSPLEPVPASAARQGAAPNGALAPLPSEADLARDLESELLNELQASFSTIPEIVGRPGQPLPAADSVQPPMPPFPVFEPPPQQPAFTPIAAVAPPVAQAGAPAPQVRSPAPPQPSSPEADLLDELGIPADMLFRPPQAPDSDLPRAPQMVPLPPAPAPRAEVTAWQPPPLQPQKKRESLATRIARATQGGEREEAASGRTEQPRAAQPPARQPVRPPQNQKPRPEANNPQFRPPLAPIPPAPEVDTSLRAIPSRWDPPVGEPAGQQMPDLSRFAPLRNDGSDEPGQKRPQAEPDFVEEFPFATGEVPDFAPPAAQAADNTIPGYGDDDQVPYPEDDFAYERRRSVFQSPFLIAAVLGIVAIGGAAAIVFRPDSAPETPPIIVADSTPTKVAPAVTGGNDTDNPSKRIYDRVDPGTEVADSQLVVSGEEPIADIPPIPGGSASPVSRVILEGGPGFDLPDDASGGNEPIDLNRGGTSAIESSSDSESIGPKKVRTVIVRPDGTIVSSAASDDGVAPALPDIPSASETPPAPAADENPLLAENFGSDFPSEPPPSAPSVPPATASIPDIPAPPPASQTPAPPAPRVQAPPPPTVVATTGPSGGPLDMTPRGATQAAPGGNGGGFLVQVSSQRSEETAVSTFRQLQRRYPSILGDRAPDIQRADLGQRGVYFRVRVGYPTRDAAIQMCESLKAAGGDCILATR